MQTIKILTTDRIPILIDAEVLGDFAIHPALENFSKLAGVYAFYSVTYMPGAGVLFRAPEIKMCRTFVERVSKLDWSIVKRAALDVGCFPHARVSMEQCKGFDFAAFKRICFEVWPGYAGNFVASCHRPYCFN